MILCTLLAWPSRKSVQIKVEDVTTSLFDEMVHTSHSAWKEVILPMLQEAESPPTLSHNMCHRLCLHLHVP